MSMGSPVTNAQNYYEFFIHPSVHRLSNALLQQRDQPHHRDQRLQTQLDSSFTHLDIDCLHLHNNVIPTSVTYVTSTIMDSYSAILTPTF
jgi:hypothetical protein